MKVTYDKEADAAYIYLQEEIGFGGVAWTQPVDFDNHTGIMINLDFDKENRLIGIEVLDAKERLPKKLLDLTVNR